MESSILPYFSTLWRSTLFGSQGGRLRDTLIVVTMSTALNHIFLISPTTNKSTTAPIVALIREPISPCMGIPKWPNR